MSPAKTKKKTDAVGVPKKKARKRTQSQGVRLVINEGNEALDSATISVRWFLSAEVRRQNPTHILLFEQNDREAEKYSGTFAGNNGRRHVCPITDGVKHLQIQSSSGHRLMAVVIGGSSRLESNLWIERHTNIDELTDDDNNKYCLNINWEQARQRLVGLVVLADQAVEESMRLCGMATEPALGVLMVDVIGAKRYDLGVLTERLDCTEGCRINVIRKDSGPVANACGGIQYSLGVPKRLRDEIDLRLLVPTEHPLGPAEGLMSNESFLLHCSEAVWNGCILSQLHKQGLKRQQDAEANVTGREVTIMVESTDPIQIGAAVLKAQGCTVDIWGGGHNQLGVVVKFGDVELHREKYEG